MMNNAFHSFQTGGRQLAGVEGRASRGREIAAHKIGEE